MKKVLTVIVLLLLLGAIGAGVYLFNYYHAENSSLYYISSPKHGVSCDISGSGKIIFVPGEEPKAGFIFYQGAKVQAEAYAPLLEKLAERGILCILLDIPGNFPLFGINAADGYVSKYPDIHDWYVGGHSLGGVTATMFLDKHHEDFDGLVLLASYPFSNLSDTHLRTLSVYGSNDGVLNLKKYEDAKDKLPADFTEIVIGGGNHANFGFYGEQKNDGTAGITRSEQIELTVGYIYDFITNTEREPEVPAEETPAEETPAETTEG